MVRVRRIPLNVTDSSADKWKWVVLPSFLLDPFVVAPRSIHRLEIIPIRQVPDDASVVFHCRCVLTELVLESTEASRVAPPIAANGNAQKV